MLVGLYGAGHLGRTVGRAVDFPFVFVDDTPQKRGTVIDGHEVLSLDDFVRRAALDDAGRLYVCIYHPGFSYPRKRDEIIDRYPAAEVYSFTDLFRTSSASNLSYVFFEPPQVLERKLARYDHVAALLSDDLSRETLTSHVRLRQTGNFEGIVTAARRDVPFLAGALRPSVTYVDAGAFDGDTAEDFIAIVAGRFSHMHIVEPDPANLIRARNRLARLGVIDRVTFHEEAISDQRGLLGFNATSNEGSALDASGAGAVRTVLLSDFDVADELYIKLDIEGAELPALRASRAFIVARRPILGISVYHHPDDLLDAVQLIEETGVSYKLYLRCHGEAGGDDLMLYAIPT